MRHRQSAIYPACIYNNNLWCLFFFKLTDSLQNTGNAVSVSVSTRHTNLFNKKVCPIPNFFWKHNTVNTVIMERIRFVVFDETM